MWQRGRFGPSSGAFPSPAQSAPRPPPGIQHDSQLLTAKVSKSGARWRKPETLSRGDEALGGTDAEFTYRVPGEAGGIIPLQWDGIVGASAETAETSVGHSSVS
ncbi:unnamed protein product [Boreogadus saida]